MSNKEKLDLEVKNFKERFKGLSLEDTMRIKWARLAAQGSVQTRTLRQKQNSGIKLYF